MAINKVVFNGETKIDLTSDTVTPQVLAEGYTAHDRSGAQITGVMQSGGGGTNLPSVTSADNGDVLTVVNGAWNKAEREKDVFWVSCQVDMATFGVSNFSKTHAQIIQAVQSDKIVKIKVFPSTGGTALGDLNNYVDANAAIVFGFLMTLDLGNGSDVYFGSVVLTPNDTKYLNIFKVNSTQIG